MVADNTARIPNRLAIALGTVALATIVLLIASTGPAVAAPTTVTNCTTINASGEYVLGADLNGSAEATCIAITSSDVVLNGAGHSITGSDAADSIGVHVNGSIGARLNNVSVRNLILADWGTGLYYDTGDVGTISNVTATSNRDYGLHFQRVTNVTVSEVTTADQSGLYDSGIKLSGSSGVTVSVLDSTNDGYGVSVSGGSGHTLRDSTIDGNKGVTVSNAQLVTVRDNSFTDTSPTIDVSDSGDVLVDNNTIIDGSLGVLSGSNGPPNRITNNRVYESSQYATGADCGGMSISYGAADDLIANNSWTQCNWGVSIQNSNRIDFRNNTISGTDGGNSDYGLRVANGAGHQIVDNVIENNGVYPKRAGILLGTHQAYLSGNTLAGNGFNLQVGTGGNWSSISHTIDATNTVEGRPVAYHVNETDVIVDPHAGWVGLIGTQNATLADMSFTANNWENVLLRYADDTVIRNVDTTPSWVGVHMRDGSDRTRIEDSHFDRGRGITMDEASGSHLVNTSVTNSDGYGVYLSKSPDTTFENVTVTGSSRRGISVQDSVSQRVTVANSTVSTNDWGGIDLYRSPWSSVRDSTVQNNGGAGIIAQRYFHNATITGNQISGNDGDGITVSYYSANNLVANNSITGNAQNGIELGNQGSNVTITGNVLTGNAVGLDFPSEYEAPRVYDNHFNNTDNVVFADHTGVTNATWNTTATAGLNVIGGATIGGNYWANQTGTGFSETCTDRGDGICDAAYTLASGHIDHLPLAAVASVPTSAFFAVTIDGTNSPIDAGQDLNVTATIENTGDESGTQSIVLEFNGTSVDNQTVTLDGGNSTTIVLSHVPSVDDVGSQLVNVSSANSTDSAIVQIESAGGDPSDVTVNGIRITDGTTPSQLPHVEAWIDDQPMLQLNLRSSETGPYDLESLGVDHTTEFEIDLTVGNFTPRLLLGAGNLTSWSTAPNGTNATDITVVVRPVATQSLWICDGAGNCTTPDLADWPTGANDTATNRTNVTVSLAVDDLSVYPGDQQTVLNGSYLTTDAQLFGSPAYQPATTSQPATLSLLVGGPHFTVDGANNSGFYTAFLPDALLADWNVTSPGQLTAAYQGNATTFSASTVTGGVVIHVDLHYSAGTVAVTTIDTTPPVADAGPDRTIDEGDTVQFDGSASTDDVDVVSYQWDVGDGTTATGTTVSKTYADSGTYTVTLTVADAEGNADTDTATVTVQAVEAPSNGGGGGGSQSTPTTLTPTATPAPTPTVTPSPTATATPEPTTTSPVVTGTPTPVTTSASTPTETPTTTETPGQPGFGIAVAVLALLAAALLAARRNRPLP